MVKRILVVDDEEDMLWSLQKNIGKGMDNVEVLAASSGEDALTIIQRDRVELVITDIRMPVMNGFDLIEKIRDNCPGMKIIVMTAYPSNAYENKAMMGGSLCFIEKPFSMGEMRTLINKHLKEEEEEEFRGTIDGLDLIDVVQINCMSGATAALKVSTRDIEGIMFFRDGNIIHAICGEDEGEQAFYQLLSCRSGNLQNIKGAESPTVSINRGNEALLLEYAMYKDELSEHEKELCRENCKIEPAEEEQVFDLSEPDHTETLFLGASEAGEEIDEDVKESLLGIIDVFNTLPDVLNVYLIKRNGDILVSLKERDMIAEREGVMLVSSIILSSDYMGEKFDKANMNINVTEYDSGAVIILAIDESVFLVILTNSGAHMGHVRLVVRDRLELLKEIFSNYSFLS